LHCAEFFRHSKKSKHQCFFFINQSHFGHWLMGQIIFAYGYEFAEKFANISD
jgi:hypothetical protein